LCYRKAFEDLDYKARSTPPGFATRTDRREQSSFAMNLPIAQDGTGAIIDEYLVGYGLCNRATGSPR
jgi:hypothetical protein